MTEIAKTLKDSAVVRWTVLIMFSTMMFASYYFYDVFSSIKTTLQSEIGLTNAEYGTMYGAYSLTNSFLFMAFFGGIILDRWGIRKTSFLFLVIMIIGTLGTAYGASEIYEPGTFGYNFFGSFWNAYSPELKMMILGRILFGLGAETFYVVLNKIIAKWFKGKELALAFAISLAFGRFGTAGALWLSPRLTELETGWTTAGWFGFMLMIIGFIAFLIFTLFDNKYDRQIREAAVKSEPEKLQFADLKLLFSNRAFIYITILCLTFYSAVFPFLPYAADLLVNKFGKSIEISSAIVTILPFGTIVFTPIFGWWCDIKGKSATLMILGSLLLILVHLTLSLTGLAPYVPMFCLGISFSLVPAAMWPAVTKIVHEKRLGTAYGTMFTIQNFGLMLIPIIMGKVLDKTNPGITAEMVNEGIATYDYTLTILLLVVLGILGLSFAFLLKRENRISGYDLEMPNKQD
jgi:MFS family permease